MDAKSGAKAALVLHLEGGPAPLDAAESQPAWLREAHSRGIPRTGPGPQPVLLRDVPEADPYDALNDQEKEIVALYVGDCPITLAGVARYISIGWRARARRELLTRGLLRWEDCKRVDDLRARNDAAAKAAAPR